MSRPIKVSNEVYEKLQKLQRPRESYSEVIERLLMMTEPLLEASRLLGSAHYLTERPKQEVKQ